MSYAKSHLAEASAIIERLPYGVIEEMAGALAALRERGGRLFFLGVGGSAGNCSHAVNDFRKLAGIESYAPTDNVSELTARTNDEGWHTVFTEWLKTSRLDSDDAVFVFSVGGGNAEKNISPNLVSALDHAKSVGAMILGIVGRDGGHTAAVGNHVVIVPTVNAETITPHSEAFQAVIWHLLVSHPKVKRRETKWGVRNPMRRAVFLDRDGVINRAIVRDGKPYPPCDLSKLEILPGVEGAVQRLHEGGFVAIVITNQPDVARGTTSRETVEAINRKISDQLALDEVMTCYHDDGDGCFCRKPRPGQLFRARDDYGLDLARSFMVGDRWRDIRTAQNAGCRSIFLDYGYAEPFAASPPDFTCRSLAEAACWIMEAGDEPAPSRQRW